MKLRFRRTACAVLAACLFFALLPAQAEGADVKRLQTRLIELGYEIGQGEVTEAELRAGNADLVFEGLDTLAEIRINGKAAARTDNMHRTWRIPVKELLVPGENRIAVTFFPALDYIEKAAGENPEDETLREES